MTFEKDFPSLKGKEFIIEEFTDVEGANHIGIKGGDKYFLLKVIKKNCLDKSFVKKVLSETKIEKDINGLVTKHLMKIAEKLGVDLYGI